MDPVSRTSTPTVYRGDGGDKWMAVRKESQPTTPGETQRTPTSAGDEAPNGIPAAAQDASAIKSERDAEKGQDFGIISYHGDGRRWAREEDGPYLRLAVNPDRNVAETGSGDPLHITVDPRRVAAMVSAHAEASGMTTVEMTMKEGEGKAQRLVFATKDSGGRLESGKLQARRFCQWVKAVNPDVAYRPTR